MFVTAVFFLELTAKDATELIASANQPRTGIWARSHSLHPTALVIAFGLREPRAGTATSAADEKVRSTQQEVAEIDR